MTATAEPFTRDALFGGRLELRQSREGYRFTTDAVLLAGLAARETPLARAVLDVGAGVGPVALALALWLPDAQVAAVEVQPTLAAHLRANVADADLRGRVDVHAVDIRTLAVAHPRELVTMNPPYFEATRGRLPPNRERAAARHQLHGDLAALVAAAAAHLSTAGVLALLYPWDSREDVITACAAAGLDAITVRPIATYGDSLPRLCYVRAERGPHARTAIPAFITLRAPGEYTDDAARLYAGP